MTPKPGEVYERDGERRTVRSGNDYIVSYYFDTSDAYGLGYETRKEWDAWAAGAKRVEKETQR